MRGGIVTQVKQPKVLKYWTLREALNDPGDYLLTDFSKFYRPPLLHSAFQALDKFIGELGRFPAAGPEEDAQKLISVSKTINETSGDVRLEELDEKLLRHFSFGSNAVLNPMAAMVGGIVGQEVLKACSGKFHPLYQFFYFDSVESLPAEPLDPKLPFPHFETLKHHHHHLQTHIHTINLNRTLRFSLSLLSSHQENLILCCSAKF
ncbi:hypothetical protein MKX01_014565 [Papaver californicum]|nr:hypothetical protein MKX01_014565 [Papaver californicum]